MADFKLSYSARRDIVIYYSIDEDGIWIERVLHGARDVDAVFRHNGN